MGILYRIDQQQGITLTVWDGAVKPAEWLAHLERMLADADWPGRRRIQISDLRTASVEGIDEATLKAAADLLGQDTQIANMKAAIVAGEAFKKAAQFERFIAQYRSSVIVFNTLMTACTWLGVEVEAVERGLRALRAEVRGQV